MTRSEWKERLPLIQAFVEGKALQYLNPYKKWIDAGGSVDFTDAVEKYRIKPEPKVIWVAEEYGEVSILDYEPSGIKFKKYVEVEE